MLGPKEKTVISRVWAKGTMSQGEVIMVTKLEVSRLNLEMHCFFFRPLCQAFMIQLIRPKWIRKECEKHPLDDPSVIL